jgi:phospholipase C
MIHKAKFKELPGGYHALTSSEAEQIRRDPKASPLLPRQEEGVRPSCPLPYELHVDGALDRQRTHFAIHFEARNEMFRERAAGAPFIVYAVGAKGGVKVRNYAVEAGQTLADSWALADFEGGRYYLRVYGPNGFFREFKGGVNDPLAELNIHYSREPSNPGQFTGGVEISANNLDGQQTLAIDIQNHALGSATHTHPLKPNQRASIQLEPHPSGWYDFTVCIAGASEFKRRYAGRVETGKWSTSDPAMA